jgi:hypothetical protein
MSPDCFVPRNEAGVSKARHSALDAESPETYRFIIRRLRVKPAMTGKVSIIAVLTRNDGKNEHHCGFDPQ